MAFTDASGTIAAANTSQTILAAGAATTSIRLQNRSGSRFYVNTDEPASSGPDSYELNPGMCIDETYLPVDAAVNIYGPDGAAFLLKYQ